MSYYARSYWTASGEQTDYTVGFPYLDKAHVRVELDGASAAFTWINDSTIRISPAPTAGTVVLVRRATSPEARLVDYVSPSSLNEDDLDNDSLQGFYLAQEAQDAASATVSDDPVTGQYTAGGKRLTNVADPTDAQDAATKAYVDSAPTSPVAQANAAAATATAAASTATTKASEASASSATAAGHASTATTKASEAAADRVQTGLDRVATGADAAATAADRVQTGLDRAATGADAAATAADRVQTGLDRTAAAGSASAAATSEANAAASAASIDPTTLVKNTAQTLTDPQKAQARANIDAASLSQALRDDVDQNAQSKASGLKVNILKNTLQAWEQIGSPVTGAGLTNVTWTGLEVFAALRLRGTVRPDSGAAANIGIRLSVDGITFGTSYVNTYFDQDGNARSYIRTIGDSAAWLCIGSTMSHLAPSSILVNIENMRGDNGELSQIQTSMHYRSSSSGTWNRSQTGSVKADVGVHSALRLLPSSGLLYARNLTLEGLR